MALTIAVPLGIAVALFITKYAPKWLSKPAASTVDLLAAVPSIVFGLWGLRVFGPRTSGIQNFLREKASAGSRCSKRRPSAASPPSSWPAWCWRS
jgi:ABC-type phosphate transport system permease subunit